MSIKVNDLMSKDVVTALQDQTVGQVKQIMTKYRLRSIPVVSVSLDAIGIVSASDLVAAKKDDASISDIMTTDIYTIPEYENIQIAARMMRNHKIHHLIVTSEKKVIGIISSFDLLKLIEGYRFERKNPATPKSKGKGKRAKAELAI